MPAESSGRGVRTPMAHCGWSPVAPLVEKKGIAYVLSAVRRLQDAGIDVSYEIAGDGPLRSSLEALRDRPVALFTGLNQEKSDR